MNMRINVKAKPLSRDNKVEKLIDGTYIVSVKEPPIQGRANNAIIDILAEYFDVRRSQVTIISGRISRNKVVEIS